MAWEQYVVVNKSCETVCAHWKRKSEEDVASMDDDSMSLNSQELTAGLDEVAFPGDRNYVGDGTQTWMNSNNVGGENEDILQNVDVTEDGGDTLGKEIDEAMMNENETVEDNNDGGSTSQQESGSDSEDSGEEQAMGAAKGMYNDKNYDKSHFANKKQSLLGIGGYSDESSSDSEGSDLDHSDGECRERRKERRYYSKEQENGEG